jgi:primosomal replication protein N
MEITSDHNYFEISGRIEEPPTVTEYAPGKISTAIKLRNRRHNEKQNITVEQTILFRAPGDRLTDLRACGQRLKLRGSMTAGNFGPLCHVSTIEPFVSSDEFDDNRFVLSGELARPPVTSCSSSGRVTFTDVLLTVQRAKCGTVFTRKTVLVKCLGNRLLWMAEKQIHMYTHIRVSGFITCGGKWPACYGETISIEYEKNRLG